MIYLSLGSNLGDRSSNLEQAVRKLKQYINIIDISEIFHSKAHLLEGSPIEWDIDFYNIVVSSDSDIDGLRLLDIIQKIEIEIGRPKIRGIWEPRIIDIDIISIGDMVMESDRLTIPHSLASERDFVLYPLREIAPNWRNPKSNKHIDDLIAEL